MSLLKEPLQPPLAEAVASHITNAELTAACVEQTAMLMFMGQISTTGGAAATVKVAWQVVVSGAQVLV